MPRSNPLISRRRTTPYHPTVGYWIDPSTIRKQGAHTTAEGMSVTLLDGPNYLVMDQTMSRKRRAWQAFGDGSLTRPTRMMRARRLKSGALRIRLTNGKTPTLTMAEYVAIEELAKRLWKRRPKPTAAAREARARLNPARRHHRLPRDDKALGVIDETWSPRVARRDQLATLVWTLPDRSIWMLAYSQKQQRVGFGLHPDGRRQLSTAHLDPYLELPVRAGKITLSNDDMRTIKWRGYEILTRMLGRFHALMTTSGK